VRHHLLPILEEYNPAIKRQLVQMAWQLQSDRLLLEEWTGRYWKRVCRAKAGGLELSIAALRRQPLALQRLLIRRAIQTLQGDLKHFEFRHWQEIERLLDEKPSGTVVSLPDGLRLVRGSASIRVGYALY
jgi:tRNA(Ile)-lysidine synthase